MSTLEEIEAAIESLPREDLKKLRRWLTEFESDRWDQQIEEDIKAGRLDQLAEEALAEYDRGECGPLP